jgi:thiol-disulfide isomerase/thioredoxin
MRVAIVFLFTFFFAVGVSAQTELESAVLFNATDSEGEHHGVKDYLDSGKYVMIYFSTYPCPACQDLMQVINQAYIDYGCNESEVIILGIEKTLRNDTINELKDSLKLFFPIITPDGGASVINFAYKIVSYPTLILIAPDRKIIYQDVWPINSDNLESILTDELGFPQVSCILSDNATIQADIDVKMFPNPSSELVNFSSANKINSVQLYSVCGQLVKQNNPNTNEFSLGLSGLSSGIYLVKVHTEKATKTLKLVVE